MNSDKINANDIRIVRTFKELYRKVVYSLLMLYDNRIASVGYSIIDIYDPKHNYRVDLSIEANCDGLLTLAQIDYHTIISCTTEGCIQIWYISKHSYKLLFTNFTAHISWITKVTTLSSNRYATSSFDTSIKIWSSETPYASTPFRILNGHKDGVTSLVYYKEKEVLISGSFDSTIRLWSMKTYQCVSIKSGIFCDMSNSMYKIDGRRIVVGGEDIINVVDIEKMKVETKVENRKFGNVKSFLMLRNGKTLICGCEVDKYVLLNVETKKYKIVELKNNHIMFDILRIDDSTFMVGYSSGRIRIIQY